MTDLSLRLRDPLTGRFEKTPKRALRSRCTECNVLLPPDIVGACDRCMPDPELQIHVREVPITREPEPPNFRKTAERVRELLDAIERPKITRIRCTCPPGTAPHGPERGCYTALFAEPMPASMSEPTVVLDERGVREFHGRAEYFEDQTTRSAHPARRGVETSWQVRRERVQRAQLDVVEAAEAAAESLEKESGLGARLSAIGRALCNSVDALRKARRG